VRTLLPSRDPDPLLARAPYKLVVRNDAKDVVLYEQKGYKGERTRQVATDWADESAGSALTIGLTRRPAACRSTELQEARTF
jgi:hypothetical protein